MEHHKDNVVDYLIFHTLQGFADDTKLFRKIKGTCINGN